MNLTRTTTQVGYACFYQFKAVQQQQQAQQHRCPMSNPRSEFQAGVAQSESVTASETFATGTGLCEKSGTVPCITTTRQRLTMTRGESCKLLFTRGNRFAPHCEAAFAVSCSKTFAALEFSAGARCQLVGIHETFGPGVSHLLDGDQLACIQELPLGGF